MQMHALEPKFQLSGCMRKKYRKNVLSFQNGWLQKNNANLAQLYKAVKLFTNYLSAQN